jgi:hypothetical protein
LLSYKAPKKRDFKKNRAKQPRKKQQQQNGGKKATFFVMSPYGFFDFFGRPKKKKTYGHIT